MKRARTWCELYSFPGFRAAAKLKAVVGDPDVRVVGKRGRSDLNLSSFTLPSIAPANLSRTR